MIAEVNSMARLRWKCRRGIKEMDLLLERFLVDHYPRLSPDEQSSFETMLDEADLDIYAWITGAAGPRNYRAVIERLQGIQQE